MAKKGTKYQIVDLGTHFVKAAVLEAQGGAFSISSAAAVPLRGLATDADGYLTELSQGFGDLADFFDRKTPIFFLCNESLARVGVAYLNNLPSGGVDDALTAERTKFISSFGTTSYEQTVANSFKLREKAQGKAVQVVAANVYAKVDHIDVLFDLCSSRKLTFGGAYPRLFAYNELFKMCFGGDPAALSSVA
ncbi:MAG: hypothetical protein HY815_13215, partial [Candidatus Riflebacteria bacterium]|nr:hypothetical protein [Candidatus Riflebacteria bacterium]